MVSAIGNELLITVLGCKFQVTEKTYGFISLKLETCNLKLETCNLKPGTWQPATVNY
jgi:hypothetical protein